MNRAGLSSSSNAATACTVIVRVLSSERNAFTNCSRSPNLTDLRLSASACFALRCACFCCASAARVSSRKFPPVRIEGKRTPPPSVCGRSAWLASWLGPVPCRLAIGVDFGRRLLRGLPAWGDPAAALSSAAASRRSIACPWLALVDRGGFNFMLEPPRTSAPSATSRKYPAPPRSGFEFFWLRPFVVDER